MTLSLLKCNETPGFIHIAIYFASFHLLETRNGPFRKASMAALNRNTHKRCYWSCDVVTPANRQKIHFLGFCYNDIIVKTLWNVYCRTWNQETVLWSPAFWKAWNWFQLYWKFGASAYNLVRTFFWFQLKLSFVCNRKLSCWIKRWESCN